MTTDEVILERIAETFAPAPFKAGRRGGGGGGGGSRELPGPKKFIYVTGAKTDFAFQTPKRNEKQPLIYRFHIPT